LAKSPEAFRTISEAAEELGVAQHVLRFWETKFPFVKPMKRAGGRRFYRPADIAVLATVRRLLHQDGYTIKGVQKLYRETGLKGEAAPPSSGPATGAGALVAELERAKARLDAVLGRR
jgi:DNA-binding transcriptional MerR regulator